MGRELEDRRLRAWRAAWKTFVDTVNADTLSSLYAAVSDPIGLLLPSFTLRSAADAEEESDKPLRELWETLDSTRKSRLLRILAEATEKPISESALLALDDAFRDCIALDGPSPHDGEEGIFGPKPKGLK